MNTILRVISEAGPLRWCLLTLTLILVLSAPLSMVITGTEGWRLFFSTIAPAMVPPMFFVYPLDMTMARVKMDGASDSDRAFHRSIIRLNVGQMALLFLAWLPFFLELLGYL